VKFIFLEIGHIGYQKNREFYADFFVTKCFFKKVNKKNRIFLILPSPNFFSFFYFNFFGGHLSLRYVYIFQISIIFSFLIIPQYDLFQAKKFSPQKC
jgi:hypothetical protein